MVALVLRRLLQTIPVLVFISMVVFLTVHLIPGDPALVVAGPDAQPDAIEALREKMGLNEPLPVQYGIWMGQILQGDFGVSYTSKYPVARLISERLPATIELTVASLIIALLLSVPLGVVAALHHRTRIDIGISVGTTMGLAVPEFWSGLLFVIVFALLLNWFPPGGRIPFLEDPLGGLRSLTLPALTLALPVGAAQARFVRSALLEVLHEQYIQTAHAKGLPARTVVLSHALRNALIPVVTVVGIQLGKLLSGAVLVETIFGWPGVGRTMVTALADRDYTTVQGTLLVMVVLFSLVNLATDVLYGFLDPRIRRGELV